MTDAHLTETPMLDFRSGGLACLIKERGWADLSPTERVGAAYDFVRNEILFGYNTNDILPASKVLDDGIGQCNTKSTLLMALLRGLDIPCRFHGFTIDKSLQRGIVPELFYPLAPRAILHSWVEVRLVDDWIELEGFILDEGVLRSLQRAFPNRDALCGYGAGTDSLHSPAVEWNGVGTYIQRTGINRDLGVFDTPDAFYAGHRQLSGLRGLLYRYLVRPWMNRRVEKLRDGIVPKIGDGATLSPSFTQIYNKPEVI